LPRARLLYDVAAIRLQLLTKPAVHFRYEVPVAGSGRMEVRSGTRTGLQFARATSSLSQGKWLARLAVLAAKRCGGPIKVLELGSSVGISGCYLLAGMSRDGGGHLVTCEGIPEFAAIARRNLSEFVGRHHLTNVSFEVVVGRFESTLAPLVTPERAPYHLVFIDGHHREDPTLAYHKVARSVLHPRGIIVHDDIDWSDGMRRAWRTITELERDQAVVELYQGNRPSRGIVLLGDPRVEPRPHFHLDGPLIRIARRALPGTRAD
jgi:predicted O-methyltransferase YrrM